MECYERHLKDEHSSNNGKTVYAAQMHRMDAGIDKVLEKLETGVEENTIVLLLSDNRACKAALCRYRLACCAQPYHRQRGFV